MNYMHSSEKIKGLRIHQGYTVEQLAEEANISTKLIRYFVIRIFINKKYEIVQQLR